MVRQAYSNPSGVKSGFVYTDLDWEVDRPLTVQLGELRVQNVPVVLRVAGIDVFGMQKPDQTGHPFRLHARVFESEGKERVRIVDNELRVSLGDVDIEHESNEIDIRTPDGGSMLRLRLRPPATFEVAAIRMAIKGYTVHLNDDLDLILTRPDGTYNAFGGPGTIRDYEKAAIWFE